MSFGAVRNMPSTTCATSQRAMLISPRRQQNHWLRRVEVPSFGEQLGGGRYLGRVVSIYQNERPRWAGSTKQEALGWPQFEFS
jgi:hypothetical protein